MPTPILPTIGRVVYYSPERDSSGACNMTQFGTDPLRADVIYVWEDGKVNLNVVDHAGQTYFEPEVRLVQDGEALPADGSDYAYWMPYQIAAAAKTEAPAA